MELYINIQEEVSAESQIRVNFPEFWKWKEHVPISGTDNEMSQLKGRQESELNLVD